MYWLKVIVILGYYQQRYYMILIKRWILWWILNHLISQVRSEVYSFFIFFLILSDSFQISKMAFFFLSIFIPTFLYRNKIFYFQISLLVECVQHTLYISMRSGLPVHLDQLVFLHDTDKGARCHGFIATATVSKAAAPEKLI